MTRIAVVTGGNKGIGYEIVRGLVRNFNGVTYLTSRNEKLGQQAVDKLKAEEAVDDSKLRYMQLDVCDKQSIKKASGTLSHGLDVLVNNAGIAYQSDTEGPKGVLDYKKSEEIMNTNFFGLLHVCEAFFPLLRSNANVVNISSTLGKLSRIHNAAVQQRLAASDCTAQEICDFMQSYLETMKEGGHEALQKAGWPNSAYAVSKIGVTALTRVQQRSFDENSAAPNIAVNACCPGWCKTDLTFGRGVKSSAQGADTPLYLALLDRNDDDGHIKSDLVKGQFVYERKVQDWTAGVEQASQTNNTR